MSIESLLERIAVALETRAKMPAMSIAVDRSGPQPTVVTPAKNPVGRPKKVVAEPVPVVAAKVADKPAGKKFSVKEVADSVVGLAAKDRPAAIAILAKYDVTQVAALKPEFFEAVLTQAHAALKAFEAATPVKDPAADPLA
jgi:hypothetical protein